MKRIFVTFTLALAMALPFSATASLAGQWYKVNNPGWHVDLFANSGGGALRCRIPHGEFLEQSGNEEKSGFVRVLWKKRLGTMEWHWKSAHNRWCPHWKRNGWVEKRLIMKIDKPGGAWIN